MEIERKFLVKEYPSAINECRSRRIRQGYLSFEPEVRLRGLGTQHSLTVKGEGDLSRSEFEIEISYNTFIELFDRVEGKQITKERYFVPIYDNLIAEVDFYIEPVIHPTVVEVEFKSEEEANNFIIPSWFGKEITYDKRFKNKNIARGKS